MKYATGTFTPSATNELMIIKDATGAKIFPKKVSMRVTYNGKVVGHGFSDGVNELSGSGSTVVEGSTLLWIDNGVTKLKTHFLASAQTNGLLKFTNDVYTATGVSIEFAVWGD